MAMKLSDRSVDVILCQQGLQFFPDKPAALREMRRVIAPGGRVFVSVGMPWYAAGRAATLRRWLDWLAARGPTDPVLGVLGAWLCILSGRAVEAVDASAARVWARPSSGITSRPINNDTSDSAARRVFIGSPDRDLARVPAGGPGAVSGYSVVSRRQTRAILWKTLTVYQCGRPPRTRITGRVVARSGPSPSRLRRRRGRREHSQPRSMQQSRTSLRRRTALGIA